MIVRNVVVGRVGHTIHKKLLSTINKILIDNISIRTFCYQPTVDKTIFLSKTGVWQEESYE